MWGLDLGSTNTLLARWDSGLGRPSILELPEIARRPSRTEGAEVARGVPSAVHVLDRPSFWARLGRTKLFASRPGMGRLALIGRPAVELNQLRHRPNFVPGFKRQLAQRPLMTVARAGGKAYAARDVARLFLRELFAEAQRASGQRIRDLVVTIPVEAYETYRAEVSELCRSLGVRRVRFLDEPVAAALGYGVGLSEQRRALVVDFGGGTLHLALIQLGPGEAQAGRAEVLAKAGRDVGGNLVDRWLLEELCGRLGWSPTELPDYEAGLWTGLMLAECCRVKEAIYFEEAATFEPALPESARLPNGGAAGHPSLQLDRAGLVALLERRGLYETFKRCLADVLAQAASRGVKEDAIDEVLMVGGSTLLPGVYGLFEERFGRGRVRAWQPFESVVQGAALYAAGKVVPSDFIVHDYALLTYGLHSKEAEHSVIIPRGTPFPTPPDFWKRQLVPTCALGEPEKVFKLIVCEIGSSADDGSRLVWDAAGRLHALDKAGDRRIVVKLNESNPALGRLDPPHSPRDQAPRLEMAFGVNAERWLCATVLDLMTSRHLMRDEPIVRLL